MRKLAAVLLVLTLSACASLFGDEPPAKVSDGMFVDAKGMTLYTFDRDAPARAPATAPCAANWPPLIARRRREADGD